ncbi:MAG: menaquinone biosynthesis protein [Bacteroidetes bacterium]|nr:menaquinone biosynthesis protein [Bacteroidota bacterium]
MKLAAVSYLNTKPFLEGLHTHPIASELEILECVPSECARLFLDRACEVALVPAAALLQLPQAHLLDKWCIGAAGQVDSVYLFSQVPIPEVTHLVPDSHSLTSNLLARILMTHHWRKPVTLLPHGNWAEDIRDTTAGVVIGDKAVQARHRYAYRYDLAEAWHSYTGLPFVFAVWVYWPNQVTAVQRTALEAAFTLGQQSRHAVAEKWAHHFGLSSLEALHYFEHSISYELDAAKQQALARYLQLGAQLERTTSPDLVIG